MPNWCNNSIAFYQDDGGADLLEAFHADIQKYQNHKDPDGNPDDWVGNWLESNRINPDSLYSRGSLIYCELNADHVRVDIESAWSPLTEVYDKMAEKYGLSYVYIAEECGCEIYVNTDLSGRFFSTRYILNYFEVSDLDLDSETENAFGKRLRELGEGARYYDSFDEVLDDFKDFQFYAEDVEGLNKCLEKFGIMVYEYSFE